jgi:hypothetical protein
MPFYNLTNSDYQQHLRKHQLNRRIRTRKFYCIRCYPVVHLTADSIPPGFHYFWLWITVQYTAEQYTKATLIAFRNFRAHIAADTTNNIAQDTSAILTSIQFQTIAVPLLELAYYTYIFYISTNEFQSLPTEQLVLDAYRTYHNIPRTNTTVNMGISEAQMRAIFLQAFGADPGNNTQIQPLTTTMNALQTEMNNTTTAVTNLLAANNRRATTKVVDVPYFHGRNDEDPYEWCKTYEAAFEANGWPNDRKVALS